MTTVPQDSLIYFSQFDSTDQLVESARKGCPESFRTLVMNHNRAVRLYLARYVNCSSQVEDLAQEVFLVAFRQLRQFRNQAKFSTWLIGIARNTALHHLRAEVKRRNKQQQLFEREIARRRLTRLENEAAEVVELELKLDALRECLDQLPPHSRELVDRYYFEKQTSSSIATDSDQKSSSIRMKLLRIRRILQQCITSKLARSDEKDPSGENYETE